MNRKILAAVALSSPLWLAVPVRAENFDNIIQLFHNQEGGGASKNSSNPSSPLVAQSMREGQGVGSRGAIFEPQDDGSTPTTAGGGTRGGSCTLNDKSIIPLIPSKSSVLTVSDYPTFFAYIPQSTARTARFVLREEGQDDAVYDTTFYIPIRPGIISVALPKTGLPPLKVGKIYHWFLALVCDPEGDGSDAIAEGWIKRIEPSSTLLANLKKASSRQLPRVYGKAGIWQETLTILAELRRAHPGDSAIAAEWENLLKQVGLGEVATEPLILEEGKRNR